MFHLVSYKWIRKTQVIPELGVDYNVWGFTWTEFVRVINNYNSQEMIIEDGVRRFKWYLLHHPF